MDGVDVQHLNPSRDFNPQLTETIMMSLTLTTTVHENV